MRFDLPAYARLRLAVIARRQRAWDTERPDVDGHQSTRPDLVLFALGFTIGAVIVGGLVYALLRGWFA